MSGAPARTLRAAFAVVAFALLGLLASSRAGADDGWTALGALEARTTPMRNEVEVGEEIVLSIELRGSDARLAEPERGETLGDFDVLGVARDPAGDGSSARWTVRMSTLESGELQPPALRFVGVAGAAGGVAELALPAITVRSLVGDEPDPAAFRDIRGEVEVPAPLSRTLGMALLGLAAALAAALVVYLMLRRRPTPPIEPDAWALLELDRLERAGLPQRREFGRFYDGLTSTVRTYVARRYLIPADRQTTREFLAAAAAPERGLPNDERESLRDLLRLADLVKFAHAEPDESECALHLAAARAFVERTRPTVDAPPREEVAS